MDLHWCDNSLRCKIGKGVVVAAGAVVTWDIPAYTAWGGVSELQIGERRKNLRYMSPMAHILK